MSHFEYVMSSNNSINENNYNNAKKSKSAVHQIKKKIVRPIIDLIKKKKRNTYRKSPQPDYFHDENDDNAANEKLEREIFGEIDACHEFSAVPVYEDGLMEIVPVFRGQRYIPVHFAKTEAGTFFWTTMMGADVDIDPCGDKNAISYNQNPELQVANNDRWAQA